MSTTKLFRKWSPVVAASIPLVINLVQNIHEAIPSAPPVAAKDTAEQIQQLLSLIVSGQETLATRGIVTSATLAAFLYALTALAWRLEEVYDLVREVPRSKILPLAGANEVFGHLTMKIKGAKNRIYLMYLRPTPARDHETDEYWREATQLFVAKSSGNLPIRRIASIDDSKKLDYLLKNNALMFDLAGEDIVRVEYELRAFPYKKTKPLRVDVIDDTAFMFATYDSQNTMITDEKIVERCVEHYKQLWADLNDWTILDTSQSEKLTKTSPENRAGYGYSRKQVEVIAKVIREILCEKPSEHTYALIKPYCDTSWEQFQQLVSPTPTPAPTPAPATTAASA